MAPAVFKTVRPGWNPGGWVRFPHVPVQPEDGTPCPTALGAVDEPPGFRYRSLAMHRPTHTTASVRAIPVARAIVLASATLCTLGWPGTVLGQVAVPPRPVPLFTAAREAAPSRDTLGATQPLPVSPAGAFLRSVLVPGWGHAAIGSYHRGAFYFVMEGATAWMLARTWRRHSDAGARVQFREGIILSDLAASGVTDEAAIRAALQADAALRDLNSLVASRRQQREDWLALGIFMVLLSGVDAFVSAHLKDFPTPLELNAQAGGGGRTDFSVGFTLPR